MTGVVKTHRGTCSYFHTCPLPLPLPLPLPPLLPPPLPKKIFTPSWSVQNVLIFAASFAQVAELVDAHG